MNILEGKLVAGKMKIAIVAARFNEFIVSKLIEGARDGMDYAAHCIEMNADSFRRLTGDLWTGKEQKS